MSHTKTYKPDVKNNTEIKLDLYRHQITTIEDMEFMESEKKLKINMNKRYDTKVGIVGDISGFGKTASAVSVIARDEKYGIWQNNNTYNLVETKSSKHGLGVRVYQTSLNKIHQTLIISNKANIDNWLKLFNLTELTVYVVHNKESLENYEQNMYNVIITVPSYYNKLTDKNPRMVWRRVIYDNPTMCNIVNMNWVYSDFYWILSSDWINVVHLKSTFINTLFEEMQISEIRDLLLIKNDDEYIINSVRLPTSNVNKVLYIHRYSDIHNSNVGKIVDVLKNTGKITEEEGIVEFLNIKRTDNASKFIESHIKEELSDLDYKIQYIKNVVSDEYDYFDSEFIDYNQNDISELEDKKQTLERRLGTLKEKNFEEKECPICYTDIKYPLILLCCNNKFCANCIFECTKVKNECPMCRHKINLHNIINVKDDSSLVESKQYNIPNNKNTELFSILKDRTKDDSNKIIILTEIQDKKRSEDITQFMKDEKIPFFTTNDNQSTSNIKKIKLFKNSKKFKVMFCTYYSQLSGLDLPEVSDVILLDDYVDNNSYNTVLKSTIRIGRTKGLTVHKFFKLF